MLQESSIKRGLRDNLCDEHIQKILNSVLQESSIKRGLRANTFSMLYCLFPLLHVTRILY